MAAAAKLALVLMGLTDASVFLGSHSHLGSGNRLVSKGVVEQMLDSELGVAGGAHSAFEDELRPMFAAMPKNQHGKLEPSVTRYALHRYFAQKFGWNVVGLEPAGATWNSSSPGSIVKDRVPAYIQTLFEQRQHGEGLGLSDLATFAATLLDLVHKESVEDLEIVYAGMKLSQSTNLSPGPWNTVTNFYTVLYFHGMKDVEVNDSLSFRKMEQELRDEFISWSDVSLWARDLGQAVKWRQNLHNSFARHSTSFDKVAEFARELAHNFGTFQNLECKLLKRQLLDMEYRGTGRVRLSEFHGGANDDDLHFTESVEYLDALGALDKSEASQPRVIIPNFLSSQTNCVSPSDFYSVCCLNECEQLMTALERVTEGPTAAPALIAQVISALPSDTVDAPRSLSAAQLQRLEEIADLHGGQVPLHGRLFAQWMHHAYPRECPYPHVAGTTNPLSPDEWIAKVGSTEASEEEIEMNAARRSSVEELAVAMTPEAMSEALPWETVEELVATHKKPRATLDFLSLPMVGLLAAMAASTWKAKSALHPKDAYKLEKHLV